MINCVPIFTDNAAQKIPDVKVIALDSGGHIFMGQQEKVRSEVVKFLKQHAATESQGER